jgi:hypothetical protein
MPTHLPEELSSFYLRPGPLCTIPNEIDLSGLPDNLPDLVALVQGLLLHIFWIERYGVSVPGGRRDEVNLRDFSKKFPQLLNLDPQPVTTPRNIENRLIGNCRDFSNFLAAFLKRNGIPARSRCGFGCYFTPGTYEDHWITEYWNTGESRWVMVDAQLDELQKKVLGIKFNTLDVPAYQFVTGGKAWLLCRSGQDDPGKFGIHDMRGMDFIRGDLIRDFLALNNLEILPWDCFGLISKHGSQLTENEIALLDHIAGLTLQPDESFDEIKGLYASHSDLQIPVSWLPIV